MGRRVVDGLKRLAVTVAVLVWCLAALLVFGWIAFAAIEPPDGLCLHSSGDSNFGDASWSWFPLGTECTFTEEDNGVDEHQPAGWSLTVVVVGLAAAGVGIERARRHVSRPQLTDAPVGGTGSAVAP